MVANPMQRKARNSFLLGMIITLIVCIIVGGAIFFLITSQNKAQEKEEGALTYAYSLIRDVKSGEEITSSMVQSVLVTEKAVPKGAFASKTNTSTTKGKEEWVDTAFPIGYKSKVDLTAGTILSSQLVYEEEKTANDLRYVEYNMLTLPTTVSIGDYIDIRITFANGQDLIVVSKKEVKTLLGDTVGLELTEGEILMMNSAIVESYIMKASKIYAIQYVEPGIQVAATKTYTPTAEVQGLIERNPNITAEAKTGLFNRFNSDIRIWINNGVNVYEPDQKQTNIEEGLQKEIENAKAAREAYLSGLTSY